eukprot:TRINITY_DN1693_c2_g1_i1.p1 TRINITY_DN1693_c2_g1~~TRINITY_DN1693_c2_g1_i1.p1  ORF type:complete len:277 (+),score=19.96 TRINITY_DN1693_c2_g1_i1:62-832(+)
MAERVALMSSSARAKESENSSTPVKTLPVLSESALARTRALLSSAAHVALDSLGTALQPAAAFVVGSAAAVFGTLYDPPERISESIHTIYCSNLTELELAKKIYYGIEDIALRDRMVGVVKPLFKSSGSEDADFLKAYSVTNINELPNETGDSTSMTEDVLQKKNAERHFRHVYYCRIVVSRKNNLYTLLMAYYSKTVDIPIYSLKALLTTSKEQADNLEALIAVAFSQLHNRMHNEAPHLVQLKVVDRIEEITAK